MSDEITATRLPADLAPVRENVKKPGTPPVLFYSVEFGKRAQEVAVFNPEILLEPGARGDAARRIVVDDFIEKLQGLIRLGLADRRTAP